MGCHLQPPRLLVSEPTGVVATKEDNGDGHQAKRDAPLEGKKAKPNPFRTTTGLEVEKSSPPRSREKNVLDILSYRSGVNTQNPQALTAPPPRPLLRNSNEKHGIKRALAMHTPRVNVGVYMYTPLGEGRDWVRHALLH
jgi:hypothetical protein